MCSKLIACNPTLAPNPLGLDMPRSFAFDHPDDALTALAKRLSNTQADESWAAEHPHGRVLAQDVQADRDSPAADVSAMDGYALRMSELQGDEAVPVSGECSAGSPPPEMPLGCAMRIFTGAIVPAEAEVVIKREDVDESGKSIRLTDRAKKANPGDHIRRAGENIAAGESVLPSGTLVTAAQQAAMTNFGVSSPSVFAPVRVCVLTTGDEVGLFTDDAPKPWQLRNSNQAALVSCLSGRPWIDVVNVAHAKDDRDATAQMLADCLQQSDVVLSTGGVSMGDYDYVPDAIKAIGGEIIFHGLPLRPGKPILGAVIDGKLIMGLPGNPVSATLGCRRMALPLLAKISGQIEWLPPAPTVRLTEPTEKTIPLHWMQLVKLTGDGQAQLVPSKGSGDLVSLGRSDGFVHVPPNESGVGPWAYHAW